MTIDTIPGLRALTLSPDYRNALKLPEEPAEEYEMLAQGEYNINFRFRHPVTGEQLVLRVNSESQMHLENQNENEGNALKLLENYAAFEEAGVSGENLSQAKAKIEKTMDSIVAGFEHQLDELYRSDAMDIDSDIRVMETMLRRETASVADDFGLGGGTAVQQQDE